MEKINNVGLVIGASVAIFGMLFYIQTATIYGAIVFGLFVIRKGNLC